MTNKLERGITIMSIINILYKTAILFICSVIQMIAVLIEGMYKLLGKLVEGLETIHDKLLTRVEKKKKKTNIDIPL